MHFERAERCVDRRTYDYVVASGCLKGKILQMKVVEDFDSKPHKTVSFVVRREKERKEWSEQKLPKVQPGYSGGRLPGRNSKREAEEGGVDEDGEERRIRGQLVPEVVAGITEKASVHDGEKDVNRPVEQSCMRSWDCSQIENEEQEESWREGDNVAAYWEEVLKLEEIVEQRRIEGHSLKLEVMRKAPELVVHERMSQGNGVRSPEEKNRVPRWS